MAEEKNQETEGKNSGTTGEKNSWMREKASRDVVNTEVGSEMKKAYLDYAMSVIVSRALPAVEDGLKPVQRRILYAMHIMGLKHNTSTKKSARVVGDVIGKFHPHGDSAVYEAMVRMAQDFSLRYPLVFGQGNFGSVDGDPPAAMRYTEAKLRAISQELLQDIDKETVNFVANYDNSLQEPTLLPGKLPGLLLNGASGIAVGMATNIPPHNLTEVCDAIVSYIKNPEITLNELTDIVKGPDFPTGGSISGDMDEMYGNGKGRLIMRGKTTTEKIGKKDAVVITEIPFLSNKSRLVEQIAKLAQDKKIKNLSDIRDESAKGKIRIVLELKKGTEPKFVINALYKYTRLQEAYNSNFLALVRGQPKVLNLKDILIEYVNYRKKIVTKRSEFELKKAKERLEIVEGLLIALKNIDDIINLIKKSPSTKEAKEGLMDKYKLSQRQAQAILETKLQQLTSMEAEKLKKEHEELKQKIQELEKILGDVNEILNIVRKETEELKKKYGDKRNTNVLKTIKDIK